MDPGGISLLGPDECAGQEDVKESKEMGAAGQSGLSQAQKKRIKEMNGRMSMSKFSPEASLSLPWLEREARSSWAPDLRV